MTPNDDTCTFCGETGHTRDACPAKAEFKTALQYCGEQYWAPRPHPAIEQHVGGDAGGQSEE